MSVRFSKKLRPSKWKLASMESTTLTGSWVFFTNLNYSFSKCGTGSGKQKVKHFEIIIATGRFGEMQHFFFLLFKTQLKLHNTIKNFEIIPGLHKEMERWTRKNQWKYSRWIFYVWILKIWSYSIPYVSDFSRMNWNSLSELINFDK